MKYLQFYYSVSISFLLLQVNGLYFALESHTKVLSRLHLASHILRQVNTIQQLSKRLSNTNDAVQKASILKELGLFGFLFVPNIHVVITNILGYYY